MLMPTESEWGSRSGVCGYGGIMEVRSQSEISGWSVGYPQSTSSAYEHVPVWGEEGGDSDDREERKTHLPKKTW